MSASPNAIVTQYSHVSTTAGSATHAVAGYNSLRDDISLQKQILAKVWFAQAFQKIAKPVKYFNQNEHALILQEYFAIDFDSENAAQSLNQLPLEIKRAQEAYADLDACFPPYLLNLLYLREKLCLSSAEQLLLLFFSVLHDESDLDAIEQCCGTINFRRVCDLLAYVLECKSGDIRKALSQEGILRQSGLLTKTSSMFGSVLDSFSVPYATREALFSNKPNLDELCSPFVLVSPQPKLSLDDYIGFASQTQLAINYLSDVYDKQKCGANILLYGAPGTGKTEYARVLTNAAAAVLIEVPNQNAAQEALTGEQRVSMARQAGKMFRSTPRVLLFDEAEDVFSGAIFSRSTARKHKAWINDLLENCQLPTIWISNDVTEMDPATLRRFDIIINFDDVTLTQREQLFTRVVTEQVSAGLIKALARHRSITVATVERSCAMAQLHSKSSNETFEIALVQSLNCFLLAQSLPLLPKRSENSYAFNTAFVRCVTNLDLLVEALREQQSGRICLYGPPGTGKTAFGRWVAEQIGMPVLIKRGSDLTGKYVGENEKLIAAAFAQATREGAILLIDEIDSFLTDRKGNIASWESRSVNELLTQLETSEGIFIASTNLIDTLDEAAMRRFDMKLHFDYLNASQRELMLRTICQSLDIGPPTAKDIDAIRRLDFLTPGDYALLARRHKLAPVNTVTALIAQLEVETRFKREASMRIGF